jgi:amino acid adenylation domain-containing protein
MKETDISKYELAENFWNEKISSDLFDTRIVGDFDDVDENKRKEIKINFPVELNQLLFRVSKNNDLSMYIILHTAYKVLLHRLTGQNDIVVLSPKYQNQNSAGLLPVRDVIDAERSFKETLMDVKNSVIECYKNEFYPVYNLLKFQQEEDNEILARHIIALENMHNIEDLNSHFYLENNDITVIIEYNENSIKATIRYNANRYSKETIKRIIETYFQILIDALSDSNKLVKDIDLTSFDLKNKIIEEFGTGQVNSYSDATINKIFENVSQAYPNNDAVVTMIQIADMYDVTEHENVTIRLRYNELNRKANKVAHYLNSLQIGKGDTVGLMVEHSLEKAVGILGVLKSGAAYLPVDLDYPTELIKDIVADSQPKIILCEPGKIEKINFFNNIPIKEIDDKDIVTQNEENLNNPIQPKDPAYIIYTSGSTGQQKGIVINHGAVVNYSLWRINTYEIEVNDSTLQLLSYCFDGFCSNFYSALLSGSKLVIADDSRRSDFNYIKELIRNYRVTNISMVPSLFDAILDVCANDDIQSLRFVVLAGEKSSSELFRKAEKLNSSIQFINEYGPSEATVACTCNLSLNKNNLNNIGKPISNIQIYILDQYKKVLPIGLYGEMYIGGQGLANTYINENLNSGRFINSPLKEDRLFKTGDLARWNIDGTLEFYGRTDRQVKIRGNRVELGYIEQYLVNIPEVEEAVVILKQINNNDYLYGYLVSKSDIDSNRIRECISNNFPYYMVPSHFIQIDEIPRNKNGKINFKEMPEPEKSKNKKKTRARNRIEEKLVEVWSGILEVELEEIDIDDNFFELGGHSLKATLMAAKVHQELGVQLEIQHIFELQTIRGIGGILATLLDEDETNDKDKLQEIII